MRVLLVLFLAYISLSGSSCRNVGNIDGLRYNDMMKRWFKQDVKVYVCNNEDYPYYINIQNLTASRVALTDDERKKLIEALEKARKWAKKAKSEKVSSFSKGLYSSSHYSKNGENSLKMRFFTSNNGKQNDLILDTVDFDNMFKKGNAYINSKNIDKFINTLKKSVKVLKDIQKADNVANSFN